MVLVHQRSLLILSFLAAVLLTPAAFAQPSGMIECAACDPWVSLCSEECYVCAWDSECQWWSVFTCGQMSPGCVDDECTPNWNETSRVNVGTYDGRSWNGCTHHRVDEVTFTDAEECNTNPAYNSFTYCDDWIDDYKVGCCYPSCCEGVGENNTQLSCNDVHSCS